MFFLDVFPEICAGRDARSAAAPSGQDSTQLHIVV